MKKSTKKLNVVATTIRNLQPEQLKAVTGGSQGGYCLNTAGCVTRITH